MIHHQSSLTYYYHSCMNAAVYSIDQNMKKSRTNNSHLKNSIRQCREIKTPSSLVPRRTSHASCSLNDQLFIHGGYDLSQSEVILQDLYAFGLKEERWSKVEQKGKVPGARHSHSMVAYQDQLVMFGGMINTMTSTNQVHTMNPTTGQWTEMTTKCPPEPVDSHRACIWGDKMIVATGYSGEDYTSNIYALDLKTQEWQVWYDCKKQDGPSPRAQASVTLYNDSLILFGGKNFNEILGDVWVFDLQSKKFSEVKLAKQLAPRHGHAAIITQDSLFIFGGTTGLTHERNDLVSLNLKELKSKVCWSDSQDDRIRQREEKCFSSKRSRRDSGARVVEQEEQAPEAQDEVVSSPGKYRTQLKEVDYYNQLYRSRRQDWQLQPRTKRNPLLNQLHPNTSESLLMTSTFELLSNSLLLTMNDYSGKEDKMELTEKTKGAGPKARDNCTADLWNGSMVIFGGSMHRVTFNDLLVVNLDAVQRQQAS